MQQIDNSNFYNIIASNYDKMINIEKSIQNKYQYLKEFLEPGYKEALDLGCGSGADSISLAKLGLSVDAYDHSKEMIERAKQNSAKYNARVNFYHSELTSLNTDSKKFDLIVSLGNTLPNIDKSHLNLLFKNIPLLLNKNGKAVFQIINYSALPNSGEYILKKNDDDKFKIVRKYIIHKLDIDFIIETTNKKNGLQKSIVTKLFPYKKNDFSEWARENNLSVQYFGNLNRKPYIELQSPNLIIEMKLKNEKT